MPTVSQLINSLNCQGTELYGEQWPEVQTHLIERLSGGMASKPEDVSTQTLQRAVDGLTKLKRINDESEETNNGTF